MSLIRAYPISQSNVTGANQSVKMLFTIDANTSWSVASGTFTCLEAGTYLVQNGSVFTNSNSGIYMTNNWITHNGSTVFAEYLYGYNWASNYQATVIGLTCAVNDTVELWFRAADGSTTMDQNTSDTHQTYFLKI